MKFFIILSFTLYLFSACSENSSGKNESNNKRLPDTKITETNKNEKNAEHKPVNKELKTKRSNEEQIQFIKKEFKAIENKKLNKSEFHCEIINDYRTNYRLKQYSNDKNEIVKIHFSDETEGLEGSVSQTFYYHNQKLFFAYYLRFSASATLFYTYENRYYFKENRIIKHLHKLKTSGSMPDENGDFQEVNEIEEQEHKAVKKEIQKEISERAYQLLKIKSDKELKQWAESLY